MKVISVMSGKGGVGKTTTACLLACFSSDKHKTLILDFDISGPSLKNVLFTDQKVTKARRGLNPVKIKENLYALSMSYLIKDTDAIIWRGPKKLSILNLFYESINDFEYVIIDMPPGLSEEHEFIRDKNAVACIVTTPQNMSLNDATTSLEFCKNNNIQVACIIENMSGFNCENCNCNINLFGSGGSHYLANEYNIEKRISIKLNPKIAKSIEDKTFIDSYNEFKGLEELKMIDIVQ